MEASRGIFGMTLLSVLFLICVGIYEHKKIKELEYMNQIETGEGNSFLIKENRFAFSDAEIKLSEGNLKYIKIKYDTYVPVVMLVTNSVSVFEKLCSREDSRFIYVLQKDSKMRERYSIGVLENKFPNIQFTSYFFVQEKNPSTRFYMIGCGIVLVGIFFLIVKARFITQR